MPPPADEPAPATRAFRAIKDCTFAAGGQSIAVRAGKVYTETRHGSQAMDLMARSKAFEPVVS